MKFAMVNQIAAIRLMKEFNYVSRSFVMPTNSNVTAELASLETKFAMECLIVSMDQTSLTVENLTEVVSK